MTPGVLDPLYTFSYDEQDRVDTVTAHYIPGAPVLDSGYDPFGNRDRLALNPAAENLLHQWTVDALNRTVVACLPPDADPAVDCEPLGATQTLAFAYLDNDDLQQITRKSGLQTDFTYYDQGPIHTIRVGSGPLHALDYTVDAVFDVATVAETIAGGVQTPDYEFGYDNVYRLTKASYPTGPASYFPTDEGFAYDAAGNRDADADFNGTADGTHAYDANNRLTASPATPVWCPDADGNLATKRSGVDCTTGPVTETFTFDATNRLRSWTDGTTTASYTYDPFGRRIRKVVDGTTTWYLWDGDQLLAEYDASGNRQVRYAYAGGFAPAQVAYGSPETIYDVHTDHLDTPRMLTDASQTPVWRAAYEAFGTAHLDPGNTLPEPFNLRFPGQYYDAETGLHYNRFRYYDPGIGRYVSADPIGQFGMLLEGAPNPLQFAGATLAESGASARDLASMNLYQYAMQSPVNSIDTLGLQGYLQRAGSNFLSVNGVIPGIAAPPFSAGLIGASRLVAQGTGTLTGYALARIIHERSGP